MLLITASSRGQECIAVLEKACGEQVDMASSTRQALKRLRTNEYTVVIIDQNLIDPDPLAIETMLQHIGTAVPVYINFALSAVDRVVRDVQTALRRREAELLMSMRAASTVLRNDLKSAVTGILLSSELALTVPSLPSAAEVKIRFVHELADTLRRQLDTMQ